MPTAADYLAARRHNDRSRLDRHWRQTRPMLARLVLNRLLEGMADDDRLLNWIFDYAFEPCWVVSAHLPKQDLPLSGHRQTDLAGCEMAGELAEVREVLLPWLQGQSGTLADSIVAEIDRRCLTPLVTQEEEWWARHASNNWAGVCAGSLLTACLSLEAQGLARPQAKRKAVEILNRFFARAFTATGECEEGPTYWQYGVEYACLALSRMSSADMESQFDVQRIRRVAQYPERAHIAGNCFFAGNDSTSVLSASIGPMAWLAEFADSPFLRWWVANYPAGPARSVNGLLRDVVALPSIARWKQAPFVAGPHADRLLEDQQAGIFQRASRHGTFTFTLSGGHNDESHNHNDLGTFQLLVNDQPWIPDLGAPEYKTDFFGPNRYRSYIVACSSGHCCPAINGHEQRPGREACSKVLEWSATQGRLQLDLTSAYPAEAGLATWVREVRVPADTAGAVLQDLFQLQRDGEVTHRIWFRQEPRLEGNTMVCGPVVVHLDPTPAALAVQMFLAGDPRLLLRDFPPGHRLYRVDCTYRAQGGQALKVQTRITPFS